MNGSKPPGRSRPTNNQLLYKAHFRWDHYTQEIEDGIDQPQGTEACASVTSAFLQVLATVHNVESARTKKPRNILHILSTNTRRTKVVELSTGTHRVADELRRHSLSDGEGGHYSTNLDRNRYGSDNNYLFTVTRYNLECLGLCPCMVDIEIVDTRNGNESQLVTAGAVACSCDSPERAELADASHFAGSNPKAAPPSPRREMRRVASAGTLNGGGGGSSLRRAGSAHTLRRPPSTGRLYEYGNAGQHPAHSRGGSGGGSDLFDALLMAATGEHDGGAIGRSHGEPPVSSRQRPARVTRPSARALGGMVGSHDNFQDSLQNAVDALRGTSHPTQGENDDEGGLARLGSTGRGRRMPRRNSVSMIVENPVLAQTGAGDSLMMGQYFASYGADAGGGADYYDHHSTHSGEGDTDRDDENNGGQHGDDPTSIRRGLLRHFHKQSSAVNLNRLGGGPAEIRRLQEEIRQLREESRNLEVALEESKSGQKEAERTADEATAACRKAADVIANLKLLLRNANIDVPVEVDDVCDGVLKTTEQEIELLRAELSDIKQELAKSHAEKKDLDLKLRAATASMAGFAGLVGQGIAAATGAAPPPASLSSPGGGGANATVAPLAPPNTNTTTTTTANNVTTTTTATNTNGVARSGSMPPPASASAAAAAAAAFHMPYAMGMLPMFGMPPLNPYGGMHHHAAAAAAANFRPTPGGAMQKVASMPAMHHGGLMSPPVVRSLDENRIGGPALNAAKRKAEEEAGVVGGDAGETTNNNGQQQAHKRHHNGATESALKLEENGEMDDVHALAIGNGGENVHDGSHQVDTGVRLDNNGGGHDGLQLQKAETGNGGVAIEATAS